MAFIDTEELPHFAYAVAGCIAIIVYIFLLIVFCLARYCMRKCPTFITGRQPQRRNAKENQQIPQQNSTRRIIVVNKQQLMAQGITVPTDEAKPEMIPANLNNPLPINGKNGIINSTQNFLTQETFCETNEKNSNNGLPYPVNLYSSMPRPTAPQSV